jgi:peptidyl-prolyl cis-trans isomerase C
VKPHRRPRLLLAVLAVASLAAACGGDAERDGTVIATIGDRELTQGELDDLLPDGENTVSSRVASIVESWLTAQAVELEIADRGFPVTDDDRDLATDVVGSRGNTRNDTDEEQLINAVAISYAVGRWTDVAVVDAGDPELPNYLCSNHLLVETEEEAQAALQRFIDDGEAFADLAIELSTGPSGPSGGDLGCAVEGAFVPEFEEAAYAASAGDVVGPVETDFGWHLIEVESVGPADADTHPDADPVELAQIAAAARESQIDTLIFDLEQQAAANHGGDATVDASIGTLDGEGLEITPA